MKNFVRSTYHFTRDGDGNSPDENGVRREIEETGNLLALDYAKLSGPELRAVKSMTEGFTIEQFNLFCDVVSRQIRIRRERHANYSGDATGLSKAVLEQTDQIERRWKETEMEIRHLIAKSEACLFTGLEPNSEERRAAESLSSEVAP